jgi:hypothetical protein
MRVELLTLTGGQVAHRWQQQDLEADGTAVSLAGLDPSPVWLDAARLDRGGAARPVLEAVFSQVLSCQHPRSDALGGSVVP